MKKRIISILLCLFIVMLLLPSTAFADTDDVTLDIGDGSICLRQDDSGNLQYEQGDGDYITYTGTITITGTSKTNMIAIQTGSHTVKLSNVNIDVSDRMGGSRAFWIGPDTGDTKLLLEGDNVLKSSYCGAGIQTCPPEYGVGKLIITSAAGDGKTDGSLTATTKDRGGAGIGGTGVGSNYISGGNIIINGGTVTAKSISGAGIGGGEGDDYFNRSKGSNITITGGIVIAESTYGPAIGGGGVNIGGDIIISEDNASDNYIAPAAGFVANAWHGKAAPGEQFLTNETGKIDISKDTSSYMKVVISKKQYNVAVSADPAEGGTVTGGGTFDENSSCTLKASANNGYRFVKWTENGAEVSTDPNYQFTVTEDRNLVAVFEAQHIHTGTLVPKVESTFTSAGNKAYYVCSCGKWFEDAACTVEITDHNSVIIPMLEYAFTAGTNGIYTENSEKGLEFTANGPKDDCTGIKVDGALIDPSNYTLSSGSTIITLKNAYLETLSVGEHTITAVYGDKEVTTTFKVAAASQNEAETKPAGDSSQPTNPKTGDNSNLILWIALLFVSGIALITLEINKKHKKIYEK